MTRWIVVIHEQSGLLTSPDRGNSPWACCKKAQKICLFLAGWPKCLARKSWDMALKMNWCFQRSLLKKQMVSLLPRQPVKELCFQANRPAKSAIHDLSLVFLLPHGGNLYPSLGPRTFSSPLSPFSLPEFGRPRAQEVRDSESSSGHPTRQKYACLIY